MRSGQVANTVIFSGLFLSLSLTLNFRQNYQSNCGMWAVKEEKGRRTGKEERLRLTKEGNGSEMGEEEQKP